MTKAGHIHSLLMGLHVSIAQLVYLPSFSRRTPRDGVWGVGVSVPLRGLPPKAVATSHPITEDVSISQLV